MLTIGRDFLHGITGERSMRAIALRTGMDPSTLSRQLASGLKPDTLAAIARAYGQSPISALIAAGFYTADEARQAGRDIALAEVSTPELLRELLRRAEATPSPNVVPLRHDVDLHTVDLSQELAAATDDDGGQEEFPNG